jgi:hemerythrin-like domain-containing protein
MKRHVQLQPLSRQHHNGLLAALLVKKGLQRNTQPSVVADFILKNWENDLEEHFTLEEVVVIPAAESKQLDDNLTQQLLQEHRQIRSIITSIQQQSYTKEDLHTFADLLEKHIRFEERIYFPEVEKLLTEEEMLLVGAQLHDEKRFNCINYPIKFWE